jgi:hypothetical protein
MSAPPPTDAAVLANDLPPTELAASLTPLPKDWILKVWILGRF